MLERAEGRELLDDPEAPPSRVGASLRNIATANTLFGGAAAVRWGLRRALAGVPAGATLTMLDVGTGMGDLPTRARAWASRLGVRLVPVGLDRHRAAARLAHGHGLTALVGDGAALPIRSRGVDVVLLSQVAHHFGPCAVVHLLRECDRVARRAVIVADLRRSRAAAFGWTLAARVLRFDDDTLRDGLTSLARGYTLGSFRSLLEQAGVTASVIRRPGSRIVAVWNPSR
ncbi:MAG: methyltransferase domain-containing protein [Gemmatimonadales bacterium]